MAVLKTISEFQDQVSAILSGMNLNTVADLYGTFERAARTLCQKVDIPEASGIQNIVLYSGVFDYACDTTIFGTAITDIRPQGISRPSWDTTTKTTQQQFDRLKNYGAKSTTSTFEFKNGVPIIRINASFPDQNANIDPLNAIGNSPNQWVAAGTASGLTQDNAVYYQSPSSLRFTVTGLGTGTLTKNFSSPTDYSSYQGVGVVFLAIMIPQGTTATNLATMSIKIGSSSTNYNLVTMSQGFLGSWVSGEWLLVAFDMSTASTVGTPDWTAIDYVQVLVGTLATTTNFRVGDLFISQPTPSQILFQSAAIFLPSGSTTALTTISASTDTIILNNPAYNIFLYEGALAVLENTSGAAGDSMTARIESKLNGARARNGQVITQGLYDLYRGDNPSQELRQTNSYYDVNNGGAAGYGNIGLVY